MTPAIANVEVRDYLAAVRAELADLDAEEREHLLSDTEASLLEAAEDGEALPLDVRLGPGGVTQPPIVTPPIRDRRR